MKKRLFAIVTLFALIVMLASCANEPGKTDEAAKPHTTENPKTEESASVGQTEPIEASESVTETEAEPSSKAETSEPDENVELALNMDLIEEYSMSFGELKAKHGDITDFYGGQFYKFENGYADYGFYIIPNTHDMVTDSETGVEYQRIDENEKSWFINNISPESLFNKPFETLTIKEISKIEGVTNIKTEEDGIVTPRAYATSFNYKGWNDDDIRIIIYHEDIDMIDITSTVSFYIHPLVLDSRGIGPYHTMQESN